MATPIERLNTGKKARRVKYVSTGKAQHVKYGSATVTPATYSASQCFSARPFMHPQLSEKKLGKAPDVKYG